MKTGSTVTLKNIWGRCLGDLYEEIEGSCRGSERLGNLGYIVSDGPRVAKAYLAETPALGEVVVVRIHVDGPLPSLPLASTAAVRGDAMYLSGFPALPDDSEAAALQPTLTEGQIAAIKPNGAGRQLLQHDATASPGASGASALNQAGEVIGILVSGAVDSEGRSLGENYLMPLDSVRRASPSREPVPWTLILIAGGTLLLVVASGAFGYWLSRRRQNRVAVQTVGNGVENEQNPDASAAVQLM